MRIYLDNAATSWPKPESVYAAADRWQRENGAASGRGATRHANESDRIVAAARKSVAQLIAADDPRRIVFTHNGTDSLNLALHGSLRPGDHVVTTVCEHNSVLRPLSWLSQHKEVSVTYVPCDREGYVDPVDIRAAITPRTRMVAMVHASNVTGAVQPVEAVGQIAAEKGMLFLLDAAQSLGHLAVDVSRIGCHLLAAPGHKGLLGPLGTGILYVGDQAERQIEAIRQGGTGTQSDDVNQPSRLPEKLETGNLNVPGLAGLDAGIAEVMRRGVEAIAHQQVELARKLIAKLSEIGGVALYGPAGPSPRIGVVGFNLDGWDPQELATLLDSQWSIQTRAGLHCAPKMHAALGTAPAGCVRVSFGIFSTEKHVDALAEAIGELAGESH